MRSCLMGRQGDADYAVSVAVGNRGYVSIPNLLDPDQWKK